MIRSKTVGAAPTVSWPPPPRRTRRTACRPRARSPSRPTRRAGPARPAAVASSSAVTAAARAASAGSAGPGSPASDVRRSSSTRSSKVQSSRAVMMSWQRGDALRRSRRAWTSRTGLRRRRASRGPGVLFQLATQPAGRVDHVREVRRRQRRPVVVLAGAGQWAGAGRPRRPWPGARRGATSRCARTRRPSRCSRSTSGRRSRR